MKYPIFHGAHELTIDDKNRLLVPASVRRVIPQECGEAFFVVDGVNHVPWLYPERVYEEMVRETPTDMLPDEDQLAFDQYHYGLADRVPWDKQGRILLQDSMLKESGIGKDVTLVGTRDHLELWNRADWTARRSELVRTRPEIIARARKARREMQQLQQSQKPQVVQLAITPPPSAEK